MTHAQTAELKNKDAITKIATERKEDPLYYYNIWKAALTVGFQSEKTLHTECELPMNVNKTSVLHKLLFEWNDENKRFTRIDNMVTTIGDLPLPKVDFATYKVQTNRQETKE